MKRLLLCSLVFVLSVSLAVPAVAQYSSTTGNQAMETTSSSPIAVSLFDPIQWPDRSTSVTGLRLNLIYAEHRDLTGVDLGLLLPVNRVSRDLSGIQLGLFNGVERDAGGIQFGTINYVGGNFTGWQYGAGNITRGKARGLQLGLYNQARSVSGVQLGLLNVTDSLYGVQVGVGNFKNEPNESFPGSGPSFMPIVNWSF